MRKVKKSNFYLLGTAVFLQIFSLLCSVYRDSIYIGIRWPKNNYYTEIKYWLNFFAYWCAQTSLLTIIYFVYKIFKKKPNFENSYFSRVFGLIVINANIISIVVFTISIGIGMLPVAKGDKPVNLFLIGEVSSRKFWWFYGTIWHYIAPALTIAYFVRQKIDLAKTYLARRKLFFYSFLHPLFYFIFVLLRPLICGPRWYTFTRESPHYPYFFFNWVGTNNFDQLFWSISVIISWLLLFWISTLSFWNYAGIKLKNKQNNNFS